MQETKVICVKVANLRPNYQNLKEWIEASDDHVYIGRPGIVFVADEDGKKARYPPSSLCKWQNPFRVGKETTREEAIELYRKHLVKSGLINEVSSLRGKVLGCWCKPEGCHGDVLAQLADQE